MCGVSGTWDAMHPRVLIYENQQLFWTQETIFVDVFFSFFEKKKHLHAVQVGHGTCTKLLVTSMASGSMYVTGLCGTVSGWNFSLGFWPLFWPISSGEGVIFLLNLKDVCVYDCTLK